MTALFKFRAGGAFLVAVCFFLASCLHDPEPKNRRGTVTLAGATVEWDTLDGGGFDTISIKTPDGYFDDYVQPVFDNQCIACHRQGNFFAGWLTTGADSMKGLDLTSENSYDLIVNVESFKNPPMLRVKPEDLENSFLYLKLFPNPPEGDQMPVGSFLDEEEIAPIKFWILDGASRN